MAQNPPLILPFSQIRAADLPLVGGNGANLGEMAHAGFPVPPGFCLTTAVFQRFMAACPNADDLYALLDTVTAADVATARQVGQQIRQALLETAMPSAIAQAIRQQWQALGADQAYAVRSSATAEDLPDASFAGQQDTYLNIIGVTELLTAVQRCWVSLFTDRAILYRVQNQFSHREVQLSVVVQQMVMAEKSGILFTADPLTGHRHTLTIDASFGLGEALVSGIVSPDAYRVDKRDLTIIDRQIADKQVAIFPDNNGGVHKEALSAEQRAQTVLTDEQIVDLAKMSSQVEAHYDAPQDIEWAIVADQIYLLQARPITSLYPLDGLQSPDDSLHIYFSMAHQQNMTRAMPPLSLSSFPALIPIGGGASQFENDYLRANGGRLFIDLTVPLRHRLLRRVAFGATAQFDALAPEMLKAAMRRPEFHRPSGLHFSFATLKNVAGFFRRILSALRHQDLTGFADRTNGLIDQFIDKTAHEMKSHSAGQGQIQAVLAAMPTLFPFFMNWVPQFVAGEAAKRLIVRLGRTWLEPDELEALTLGLPGNVVTEMNLVIGDLADVARQSPPLAAWFERLGDDGRSQNGRSWLTQAAQLEGAAPFMAAWDVFIEKYGARGAAEIDIMMPRWREEPLPVLQVIAGALRQESGSHRIQHNKLVQERETAVAKLLQSVGSLRRRLIKRLYYVAVEVGGMREHHKFVAVRYLWLVKEILLQNASALAANGKLAQADDIWYLTWQELLAVGEEGGERVTAVIPQRRADLARYQKLTPPLVITSDGESPVALYHVDDAPPGALLGNPVSPGVVEGVVRVVHDPQTETLNPGEILVAPFTDPGWTPLFINAGGLIMEVGGNLTHGSVVAREYGIPAVVGVRGATTILQTGERVRIDGNRGVIEILSQIVA